jgi:transcriptional regulator with XRE-family HTH domain
MTPEQSIEARTLLGLTQEELADMADLSLSTVQEFELGRPIHDCLVATLEVALEAAGIDFIPKDEGGESVRLKKATEND